MKQRGSAAVCAAIMCASMFGSGLSAQSAMKTWKATEVWRIDGSEAGDPFQQFRDFVLLNDGQIWALDFKDQFIRRYNAAGKYLGQSGRAGGGPGEMRNANGMVVARDGKVWVNDPSNGRFTMFAPDGKFSSQSLHQIKSYGYRWGGWLNKNNGQIVETLSSDLKRGIRRFVPSSKMLDTVPWVGCGESTAFDEYIRGETPGKGSTNMSYPFRVGGGTAPDGRGTYWCASPAGSKVALIRENGKDTLATASITYPAMAVTEAERDEAIKRVEKMLANYTQNNFDKSKILMRKPAIAALYVDDDSRLWVQHTDTFGKVMTTYDVFDARGKHIARLSVPMKVAAQMPVKARGNLLWLAVQDADDVTYVAHFRLQ